MNKAKKVKLQADIAEAVVGIAIAEEEGSGDTYRDEWGDEMHPDFMDE